MEFTTLYGQITNDIRNASAQNVLIVEGFKWRLFEKRYPSESTTTDGRFYKKVALPDYLRFIDNEQKKIAIKKGYEQEIKNLCQEVQPQPEAPKEIFGADQLKQIGTFLPAPETNVSPTVGNSLSIPGMFTPSAEYCQTCDTVPPSRCLLNPGDFILFYIPASSIVTVELPVTGYVKGLTTLPYTPANVIIAGSVVSYIPGTLTMNVLFSTANLNILSSNVLSLLPSVLGVLFPTASSSLINAISSILRGVTLNGQSVNILTLTANELKQLCAKC